MSSSLTVIHILLILLGSTGSIKEVEAQQRFFFKPLFNQIKQFFGIHFPIGGPVYSTLLPWPVQQQQEPITNSTTISQVVDSITIISKWGNKI